MGFLYFGRDEIEERGFGKNVKLTRKLLKALVIYLAIAGIFFLIVHDDWRMTTERTDPVNRDALLQELVPGTEIEQTFTAGTDQVRQIEIKTNVIGGTPDPKVHATIRDGDEVLFSDTVPVLDDGTIVISLEKQPAERKGKRLSIILTDGVGICPWYGMTRAAGKITVANQTEERLSVGGEPVPGELVMEIVGKQIMPYTRYYWPVAAGVGAVILLIICYCHRCRVQGKRNIINIAADLIGQYSYLMKTLVARDFKVRYKASLLGVLWSFLNPLLMTLVYLFVFSTIFQSSIPHFPVYLMSGIILYNYFSEATNLGMQSIVGNAGLITKVYIPKYVFPISKAISSSINMGISIIPMLIMMALTGVAFHKSLLLLPLVGIYLIVFCIGVSLILSSCMVFFRDIQFIWGIVLMILNFFSPIFYPESIIPAHFLTLYHMNPIYQYLFFMRTIVIGGVSPNPITYLYCSLASLTALVIGVLVFKKTQARFVLYL